VFAQLPGDLGCGIVVVQHMPAGFTTEFARSLDRICPLTVVEAQNDDPIQANRVLIAPGDHHIVVRGGSRPHVSLSSDPHRNGHRPSADVLFDSVAREFGNRALGVIMTGMGRDGAMELGSILQRGGLTIGQDEATSVVYGMPRVAHLLGHVELQVPLSEIADTITRLVQENRGA
ncbi:MAG: chemotaxis protein CheB, partial [Spirochaetaceae bacterium]